MTNTHKASTRPHWGAIKIYVSQSSNGVSAFWLWIDRRAILSAGAANGHETYRRSISSIFAQNAKEP
jgi:hypothetical protein